jgi:DNA repair protein RecO (recombination protein O)
MTARRPFAAGRGHTASAAYVLHSYAWSESSLILDLFTRELGRVVVVAKGAKRPYSQMRSVLLPFQRIQVQLGRPKAASDAAPELRSEVLNLRAAEWDGHWRTPDFMPSVDALPPLPIRPAGLAGAALFSGFYLNELLMRLLPRSDPHPVLFDAYAHTLFVLGAPSEWAAQMGPPADTAAAALRALELVMLREAGLLPDLGVLGATQAPLHGDAAYSVQPELGVVLARAAVALGAAKVAAASGGATGMTTNTAPPAGEVAAMSAEQLIGLQAALEHGSMEALRQACARNLGALKVILRSLLDYHLAHLGVTALRSRQIAREAQLFKDKVEP